MSISEAKNYTMSFLKHPLVVVLIAGTMSFFGRDVVDMFHQFKKDTHRIDALSDGVRDFKAETSANFEKANQAICDLTQAVRSLEKAASAVVETSKRNTEEIHQINGVLLHTNNTSK